MQAAGGSAWGMTPNQRPGSLQAGSNEPGTLAHQVQGTREVWQVATPDLFASWPRLKKRRAFWAVVVGVPRAVTLHPTAGATRRPAFQHSSCNQSRPLVSQSPQFCKFVVYKLAAGGSAWGMTPNQRPGSLQAGSNGPGTLAHQVQGTREVWPVATPDD